LFRREQIAGADRPYLSGMDNNTLLIIIVVVLLFGGGGFFFRGRR
jgi:LPXTG-motif cell wall-anchored protein